MSDKDFRADIDMWCDLWDDAQKQGIHPQSSKNVKSSEFSGSSTQDDYFDYLDSENDSDLIHEEKTPNPVYPDSVGPDSSKEPVWVKEDLLKEVETLKNKLFDVENKLAKMGGSNKWNEKTIQSDDKNFMSEIESLRKKIEKVSSHLGIENEPSPWEIDNN